MMMERDPKQKKKQKASEGMKDEYVLLSDYLRSDVR